MGVCENHGCLNSANQRCSGCKTATYCGAACQKKAWATHKKGCKIEHMLYEMQQKQAAEERSKPVKRPRTTHCTGCNVKFSEEYEVDGDCPDCGYMACEGCSCSNSRGSCYCENSNFGHPYCQSAPQHYHVSSRTGRGYRGDRHPNESWGVSASTHPEAFEAEPRVCNNCGKVERCLKKEYL